ncbi:MAG TPA: TolC family protein, partial [Gemmatimonadaceae bacterium]|nr:TolC family protein [Gemmatimonadaceae bacterium]
VPAVAPSANVPWTAPRQALKPEPPVQRVESAVPADLAQHIQQLTLADVVDLALRNNPATRAAWSQARVAANVFGATRGDFFPTISGSVDATRSHSPASSARTTNNRTEYGPSISLNYLLFDFGGRSGSVEAARQNLFAADLSHNATLQNVVLQAETAFFSYSATAALLSAERSAFAEAQANLTSAQQRNKVGLATIADVLQAQTALSQEQLNLETIQGNLQAARGSLASALGLPANLPFDLQPMPAAIPVGMISQSVDSVINDALRNRPDLAAARAQAAAAGAQIRVAKSAELPSLSLGSNAGRTYVSPTGANGPSYGFSLGLSIPIFNGLSHQYDVAAAQARADAITALADQTRQNVITQVFVSYYALQTSEQRVATSDDLLASAQQSAQVAAGRYREGVGSIIDLLTAQSALANARAQQVQSRWQWYTALAQLARDAGVLSIKGQTPFTFSADSTAKKSLPNVINP